MGIPQKLDCKKIHEGIAFSDPVFFDDGENMFLAANRPAKKYHIAALSRWKVPYLVTSGVEVDLNQVKNVQVKPAENKMTSVSLSAFEDIDDLEELEELEEL